MATYTLWYRGTDSTASTTSTSAIFPIRPNYINDEIAANIPRFSLITKAIVALEVKRSGSSSSSYHTDCRWGTRDSDDNIISVFGEQTGVITTSFKEFSYDYVNYICSKTADAGKINATLCDHFCFNGKGTISRTYTGQKRRIEYTFEKPKVVINTSKNIDGGLITGSNTYEVEVADYSVTLTAVPKAFCKFVKWIIDGKEYATKDISVLISQNNISAYETTINAVAYFETSTITVTTNASPPEGGTVTGGGTYENGSTVTATAIPNEGFIFSHWLINGADSGSSNPISGVLTADTTVTAVFEKISRPEISSVQITPNPCEAGQGFIISVGFSE